MRPTITAVRKLAPLTSDWSNIATSGRRSPTSATEERREREREPIPFPPSLRLSVSQRAGATCVKLSRPTTELGIMAIPLVRAGSTQDGPDRGQQYLRVLPHRTGIDVLQIHPHPFVEADARTA